MGKEGWSGADGDVLVTRVKISGRASGGAGGPERLHAPVLVEVFLRHGLRVGGIEPVRTREVLEELVGIPPAHRSGAKVTRESDRGRRGRIPGRPFLFPHRRGPWDPWRARSGAVLWLDEGAGARQAHRCGPGSG